MRTRILPQRCVIAERRKRSVVDHRPVLATSKRHRMACAITLHTITLQKSERHLHRRRSGAAVVAMVVVLGSVAIALLILAGKTSIQLKSIQSTALETQQCNELIDFGEKLLARRLAANPEFIGETIHFDVPTTLLAANTVSPQLGIIELAILTETGNERKQPWSIIAYLGASDHNLRQTSKTIYLDFAPNHNKPNK